MMERWLMDKPMHCLIVEDDMDLSDALSSLLESHHFSVHISPTAHEAEAYLTEHQPNFMILDIGLPDENGIEFCKRIRKQFSGSIFILTGSSEDVDKILALEVGADNYLTKPINPRVLLSYIKAGLREANSNSTTESIASQQVSLEFGDFSLNLSTRTLATQAREIIDLSPAEFSLLKALCEHPRRILTRDQLLMYTQDDGEAFDRSIDILISRIRKKIEKDSRNPEYIRTIRNEGYLFDQEVTRKSISE